MTVSTTTTKAIYNGDGSTTGFPTTFEFFDAADIEVIERVIATGAETVKTLSTDYTVSGGNGATGTVTAVTAPASTVQWAIRRKTPLTQQIDYVENDDFPAETHEQGLDRGVMIAQERQEELDRALKFPVSDAASLDPEIPNSVDRAGQFLAFDVSGNPIAAAGVSDVPVSEFMQTLLDDADAAAGRTTLGALGDLVDDITPQLGGVLDTNDKAVDFSEGAVVASAATADIWATDGNTLHITGTTTISSFGTAPRVGAVRWVIFDGVLTLTHGANLNLPGSANITTATGDFARVYADTTTQFDVQYFRKDGTAVVAAQSKLVQMVNTQTGALSTGTTTTPSDDTIPQNTEGDEVMTRAITPKDASNRLVIEVVVYLANNSSTPNNISAALFQDTTADALASTQERMNGANQPNVLTFTHEMAAGTTSSTTFKVRGGFHLSGTTSFNGINAGRVHGGVLASSITIWEVTP